MPALHHFISAWKPATALPVARRSMMAVAIAGKILVAGGYPQTTACYLYDPSTGLFTATGSLPGATYGAAGAANTNFAYCIGGFASDNYLNTVFKYNPGTGTWTTETALPETVGSAAAVMLADSRLLVCGGINSSLITNACRIADSTATPLVWNTTTALPMPTFSHAACRLADGRVFVCGGQTSSGYTTACYLFNPADSTWTTTKPMPMARINHTAVLLSDGRVFVCGGNQTVFTASDKCWLYNPATDTWASTAPLPQQVTMHDMAMVGTNLMLLGGSDGTTEQSSCYLKVDHYVPFTHQPRPQLVEREWLQDEGRTTAGLPIAQLPYARLLTMSFSWDNMPRSDKDRLLAFMDAMGGMASEFVAVYSDGTTTAVRFGAPELVFTERSTDVFATTVPFLVIKP